MKMKVKFIPAEYVGKVELNKKTLDYLVKQKIKVVGLYTAVQFVNKLDIVKEQLNLMSIKYITSKPKRTSAEGQVLGCNVSLENLKLGKEFDEVDIFLYIGDGKFHPLALLYAGKDVLCNDPIGKSMEVLHHGLIEKIEKRKKGALVKFHTINNIGVIITTKPGQQQYKAALKLEQKYPNKKFYYFVDNNISFNQLENFPFIDVWVNTACPRIGLDDQESFRKGILNLKDVI
ncbi:MAG: diphthamide synthesis protein [Candidatus Woesearchaeota archaeon]